MQALALDDGQQFDMGRTMEHAYFLPETYDLEHAMTELLQADDPELLLLDPDTNL